jgi:serine phosphatase RsbU (regulator of sigma subunit)
MQQHHGLPTAQLGKQIFSALAEFGAGARQADDISIVLLKRDAHESELE